MPRSFDRETRFGTTVAFSTTPQFNHDPTHQRRDNPTDLPLMPTRKPLITHTVHQQLMLLLDQQNVIRIADPKTLSLLRNRLNAALLVGDDRIPVTVVTMESVVRLRDTTSGCEDVLTLVFPEHADIARGRLSVTAPVGTAIIGRHVGQTVQRHLPGVERRLEIVDILGQPAHGDQRQLSVCRVAKAIDDPWRQSVTSY